MNRLNLLAFVLVMFTACSGSPEKAEEKIKREPVKVGAEKDEHGCIPSAGYTWSVLKNGCIQVFSVGFRLNPITVQEGEEVISAFVLMSDDQARVELFLPDDHQHTVVLDKVGDLVYENKTYRYDAVKSILSINGKEVYKGNVE